MATGTRTGTRTTSTVVAAVACLLLAGLAGVPAEAHAAHSRFAGWLTVCGFDQRARVDPIMARGGESDHSHDFFGGEVTATSTDESLRAGPTTCTFGTSDPATARDSGDHSGYWTPSLKLASTGEWVTPLSLHVYARTAAGVDHTTVRSWASGTEAVFRDEEQGTTYAGADVRWFCADSFPGEGSDGKERQRPYRCEDPDHPYVAVEIMTPGCMKYRPVRWPDRFGHFAYSDRDRGCPATHAKAVPEMRLVVKYDSSEGQDFRQPGARIRRDFHADFLAAWKPGALGDLIASCIVASQDCRNAGEPTADR